ncbi:uncharacterized protein LOC110854068 isoform X3 [Folsomia candida]|uniref:uncharacterized protein LOC110854068 isoform X3 n=1 Tax=Folsomia candida TaxID=158441 RepID=UPI001604C1F2|nr:uncharacterized protein LOC110854068 isoform X3 [Folsomia candida]
MTMHSTLQRRHTWPFELVEVVCQEIHTDPGHPHLVGHVGVEYNNEEEKVLYDSHLQSHVNDNQLIQYGRCHHEESRGGDHLLNLHDERTRLLSEIPETEESDDNEKVCLEDGGKNKNKTHNDCTCSGKSSNNSNNHVHAVLGDNIDCFRKNNVVSNSNCVTKSGNSKSGVCGGACVFTSHQNNDRNQNPETFTPIMAQSPSRRTSETAVCQGSKDLILGSNHSSNNNSADGKISNVDDSSKHSSKTQAPSGFQPFQDKFNFLTKKNRDSKKKKMKEQRGGVSKEKGIVGAEPSSSSSGGTSSATIKHKDFCPHSKFQQEKLRSTSGGSNPSRNKKEPNSTSSNSSSVFLKNKPAKKQEEKAVVDRTGSGGGDCFTSTSSNNNSPQHSSTHTSAGISLGSIGTSTQGMLNKNGGSSIGSGGSASGSGLKGSVTVVTANIINCNSHHETEGKIPSANGTATGALSLQVNMANGEVKKTLTLWTNYYPEGEWGWIIIICALLVQAINHGLQLGVSSLLVKADRRFHVGEPALLGLLSSTSIGVSLFLSPVWVSFCKMKSTRLSGVFGGLLVSLGCLFTSFSSQFHQLFISYGAFVGVGVGLSRDASTLMVGQYFKRKREMVEIVLVAGSGVGIIFIGPGVHTAITSLGWILGLQVVTGVALVTFFLGTCYRSASLYHPQRRAILHLKNQKKKVKDITKREEKQPFLDFSCLRSKTLQILLLSSAFISFGINSPLLLLGMDSLEAKVDEISFVLLHVHVGAAWVVGCCLFGLIAIQKNQECRVSKQYLCQVASVICGISIIAFTAVKGYSGYVVFSWAYGFFLGGYNYALKVYTYERVRARHFPRAWSFVQSSQAIPIFIGTPLISILNQYFGRKWGYYTAAAAVFLGSAFLFLTDVRRRRLSRRKANGSSMKTCSTTDATQTPKMRRLSFAFPVEPISPHHPSKPESGDGQGSILDPVLMSKELTCISEEGLGEIDFQDIYFDDWAEYLGGDCITSCNKVENCLQSEYDPDFSLLLDKRTRRWSRNSIPFPGQATSGGPAASSGLANLSSHSHLLPTTPTTGSPSVNATQETSGEASSHRNIQKFNSTLREIPLFRNHPWVNRPPPPRSITVIDEASV